MLNDRKPYRVVSADQHINEPPDLWTRRVDRKFRERVPYQKRFPEGDAWVIEGVQDPINFGLNASAGFHPDKVQGWCRWEDVRPGGYDPQERLKEMDMDGVEAGINFPSPRVSIGIAANKDRDLHLAMIRAYNDWISEYCSAAPDRLFAVAILPNSGIRDALAELERCMGRPGIVGPTLIMYPHGDAVLSPDDDPLWAELEKNGIPLTIHVGLTDQNPGANKQKIPGDTRNWDASRRMLELLWGGVLDRFPELKIVLTEVDAGWVPFFKEQVDNRYHRLSTAARFGLKMKPSDYFDRHFHYVFVTDQYALRNRDLIGVKNLLWSDDYPHIGSDWPYAQRTIQMAFHGVPTDERDLILAGNAVRLYRLPGLRA